MKRFVIASLLVAASLTSAHADKSIVPVTKDQRAIIANYVTQHKLTPATIQKTKRGAKIATTVALTDVPAEWGADLTKYKYIYTNDKILFINPESRVLVDSIKSTK